MLSLDILDRVSCPTEVRAAHPRAHLSHDSFIHSSEVLSKALQLSLRGLLELLRAGFGVLCLRGVFVFHVELISPGTA